MGDVAERKQYQTDDEPSGLWAVLPVKPLAQGKSRLAATLPPPLRLSLNRRMLHHVLDVLAETRSIVQTIVVSRDCSVLAMAKREGFVPLREQGDGLNAALTQATRFALAHSAEAVLNLPGDLPLIGASDLEAAWAFALERPAVVIAPSRNDGGTNLLLVRPPGLLEYRFGPGSFASHCHQARALGVPLFIVRSTQFAFDVDTPDDLETLRRTAEALLT